MVNLATDTTLPLIATSMNHLGFVFVVGRVKLQLKRAVDCQ